MEKIEQKKEDARERAKSRQLHVTFDTNMLGDGNEMHVSIPNAIRRILLSEIPVMGFSAFPHHECDIDIIFNTSQIQQNEVLKQRISCIPIHVNCCNDVYEHEQTFFHFELNEEYIKDSTENFDKKQNITTEHLKLVAKTVNGRAVDITQLSSKTLLPPYVDKNGKEHYTLITRLAPGGKIHLKCKASVLNVAEKGGAYNAVCKATCYHTQQNNQIATEREKFKSGLSQELTDKEKSIKLADWNILDAKRITKPNSFEFIVESVHNYAYENKPHVMQENNLCLMRKACDIIIAKLNNLRLLQNHAPNLLQASSANLPFASIIPGGTFANVASRLEQSHDQTLAPTKIRAANLPNNKVHILIHNEGDTIGRLIEYYLYASYGPENARVLPFYNMCAYNKAHPFDESFVIDLEPISNDPFSTLEGLVADHLNKTVDSLIAMFETLQNYFQT